MINLLVLCTGLTLLMVENTVWAGEAVQVGVLNCEECHDVKQRNKEFQGPNFVGQNSAYLIKQINLFRSQSRIHPTLSLNSQDLSKDEIVSLADYYANLQPENVVLKLNEDVTLMYSPCSACHGDNGEGVMPFPRLIGQTTAYLEQQMINFKTGVRKNAMMQAMLINLSDEEIKLLAASLGSQKQINEILTSKVNNSE